MRAVRSLFAIIVLAVCARGGSAQGVPRDAARSTRDTLPEHVARRFYEAFQRHDLDATYANYDSDFTYERFGDPAGSHQRRRDDSLRRTKADTAVMRIINGLRVTLVRTDVFGAFVNQEWTERFADGRQFKHFELLEVRGGKIVREIEGDRLLEPNR
jgi:ketosteroid isomerase-like protein